MDLTACFILPCHTLLFAGDGGWLEHNFSVLAVAGPERYRSFCWWGMLNCGYFSAVMLSLSASFPGIHRWGLTGLTALSCGCLGSGLLVPYLPEAVPELGEAHILLTFSSCVGLMGAVLWTILLCRRGERAGYRPLLWGWWGILGGSALLFGLGGMVSTALEVFFALSAAQLVRLLWHRRMEEEKF